MFLGLRQWKMMQYEHQNFHHMRLKKYKKYRKDGVNLVNPDITEKGDPESAIRIFGQKQELDEPERPPAYRKHQRTGEE